jgi:hypothetical protein
MYDATPDEVIIEAVKAYQEHGGQRPAAAALGISRDTLKKRLAMAARRGMLLDHAPAMPGFEIKSVSENIDGRWIKQVQEPGESDEPFEAPAGHVVKGVSALVDPDGRIVQQWIKTREDRLDPLQVAEWIKQAFVDWTPAAPSIVPPMAEASTDTLTLIPLADWHIGMFAWQRETGENWDLKIAERVIGNAADELMERTKPSAECVVLGGGDLLHSDTNENKTAKSGNVLQVDGRYDKVIATAVRLLVCTIDAALTKHLSVRVRILKGNHDEHASAPSLTPCLVGIATSRVSLSTSTRRCSGGIDSAACWSALRTDTPSRFKTCRKSWRTVAPKIGRYALALRARLSSAPSRQVRN